MTTLTNVIVSIDLLMKMFCFVFGRDVPTKEIILFLDRENGGKIVIRDLVIIFHKL